MKAAHRYAMRWLFCCFFILHFQRTFNFRKQIVIYIKLHRVDETN